jgi:hypothetical protein
LKKVSERVRGGPFESSKNFNETQFFLTDSRWRLRDHPNAAVDRDSTENVRVRSITLHHQGNCGSRYTAATEA